MTSIQTFLRRTAAALGAIAALTVTGPVVAQTVSLSTGASCSYSQMSVLPNGNVTVTCGTTSSPGTFTLTAPNQLSVSASSSDSSSTAIKINRSGSTGSVDVPFTVTSTTGSCTTSTASPVTFADGDTTAKTIVVDTTATIGTCLVKLLAPSAGSLGSPNSKTVNVVDPNADVVFGFSNPTSNASVGSSVTSIIVTRSGGTANAWSVPVVIDGGTLAPSGSLLAGNLNTMTLNFPANSSQATLTYSPPSVTPATPALPATLNIHLGTPTSSASGQNGTIDPSGSAHSLTLTGPAVGCPAQETTVRDLGGSGHLNLTALPNNGIATFGMKIPALNRASLKFTLSQTTITWPVAPWSYEIHVNKCKGLVQAPAVAGSDRCYAVSGNMTIFYMTIFTKLTTTVPYNTIDGVTSRGNCYAPATEGPYYINVRYKFSGCGTAQCGWNAQWNTGGY